MEMKKTNVLKAATGILAVLLVISIFTNGFSLGGITGGAVMSSDAAIDKAVKFINENMMQEGMLAELKDSGEENGLYSFKMDIGGQEYDSYVTKDGKMLFTTPGVSLDEPMEKPEAQEAPEPVDVPKSEKPEVEIFVMSHCPYGTQIEKGIIPVVKLLGNKIDFNLRFVYYAMHGEKELDEQTRQYCIEKGQNSKLIPYLECFLEDGDSERCVTEAKVNKGMVETCMEDTDEKYKITEQFEDKEAWLNGRFPLFDIHKDLNEKYGVGGSPTLVINGKEAQSGRTSANLLAAICNAFEDAPEECEEELSSAQPSPGFGYEESASAGSAGSCG